MSVAYRGEWIVILGFLGAFIALYTAAAFLLLRKYISPSERVPPLGNAGRLVLVLAALGLFSGAYAMFIEPFNLEITHVKVPIAGLPKAACPIRIVQISDLHSDPTARLEPRLPDEVRKQHPDLIFFTGDAVNSAGGLDNFTNCIQAIEKIAPTFCCKGDWDISPGNCSPLERAKVNIVKNEVVTIRGAKLSIVGVDSGSDCRPAIDKAPKGMPTILLYHSPTCDVVLNNDMKGIDLLCCGHTHGGQIAVPGYGALITQSKTGKRFEHGLDKLGNAWIYTNRGIGMEGHFPRVRFCAPPELTVLELVPAADSPGDSQEATVPALPQPSPKAVQ
jgi:hypothetical protein